MTAPDSDPFDLARRVLLPGATTTEQARTLAAALLSTAAERDRLADERDLALEDRDELERLRTVEQDRARQAFAERDRLAEEVERLTTVAHDRLQSIMARDVRYEEEHADLAAALVEVEAATARTNAALALHTPVASGWDSSRHNCSTCFNEHWPCATVRALTLPAVGFDGLNGYPAPPDNERPET